MIAILQHYAPSDGFEERHLEPDFLIKVSERLNERMRASGGNDADQVRSYCVHVSHRFAALYSLVFLKAKFSHSLTGLSKCKVAEYSKIGTEMGWIGLISSVKLIGDAALILWIINFPLRDDPEIWERVSFIGAFLHQKCENLTHMCQEVW